MPAPFVAELIGLREAGGAPNTSDKHDKQSVSLGHQLIAEIGVAPDAIGPDAPGALMVSETIAHIRALRPDLLVGAGSALGFAQYSHLRVYPQFKKAWKPGTAMAGLAKAIEDLPNGPGRASVEKSFGLVRESVASQAAAVSRLTEQMPEESLLDLDVTVGEATPGDLAPLLQIGLSAKWSLRTDRAQDCVSQGSKLVALRRGRMPHFAVLTIEPRPAMLKILADGSGAIDCVYHLDLPALRRTINACAARTPTPDIWSPKTTLDRLLAQGRIRDYDDLIEETLRLPTMSPPRSAGAAAE